MPYTNEQLVKLLTPNILIELITGSTSYGLNNGNSDVDKKAVANLPKRHFFTLGKDFETIALHQPNDYEIHSLRKFITLLMKQNPTITEMLWTEERFITKTSKYGDALRDNREMFLCSEAYYAFGGYARDQLMRIKGGLEKLTEDDKIEHLNHTAQGMIDSFPRKYSEAGNGILLLNEVSTLSNGKQNLQLNVQYDNISLTQLNGMLSELHHTTQTYNKMGKRNRKPGEKLFKHAMHLLRLLISGIELLETGVLTVYREKERELLLKVRNEEFTWDEIFEMVAYYQERLKQAYEKTYLPPTVDTDKAEEFYQDLMLEWFAA